MPYPDQNFDRHGNARNALTVDDKVDATLARTLAAFVSTEDAGLNRVEFLRQVRDRITSDLLVGAPSAKQPAPATTAAHAVALLRSLHADIDAMRSKADRMEFAGFAGRAEEDDTLTIEWPNLAILSDQVAAFLKEIDA